MAPRPGKAKVQLAKQERGSASQAKPASRRSETARGQAKAGRSSPETPLANTTKRPMRLSDPRLSFFRGQGVSQGLNTVNSTQGSGESEPQSPSRHPKRRCRSPGVEPKNSEEGDRSPAWLLFPRLRSLAKSQHRQLNGAQRRERVATTLRRMTRRRRSPGVEPKKTRGSPPGHPRVPVHPTHGLPRNNPLHHSNQDRPPDSDTGTESAATPRGTARG